MLLSVNKGWSQQALIFQNVRPPAESSREEHLELQGLLGLNQGAVTPPHGHPTPLPLTTGDPALVGGTLLRFGVKE